MAGGASLKPKPGSGPVVAGGSRGLTMAADHPSQKGETMSVEIKAVTINVDNRWYWFAGESDLIRDLTSVGVIQDRHVYGPADSEEEALEGYRRMMEIDD